MVAARCQLLLELGHVQPEVWIEPQAQRLTFNLPPSTGQSFAKRPEPRPQARARPTLIEVGPEQRGQGVAAEALARDGQIGQQRQALMAVELYGSAVVFNKRRAQK